MTSQEKATQVLDEITKCDAWDPAMGEYGRPKLTREQAITVLETALRETLGPHEEGWICEAHPEREWPHDDCPGPGMPLETRVKALVYQRDQARQERDYLKQERYTRESTLNMLLDERNRQTLRAEAAEEQCAYWQRAGVEIENEYRADHGRLATKLRAASAQLRHAYWLLNSARIEDQHAFAGGLISPQVRRIEECADALSKEGQ